MAEEVEYDPLEDAKRRQAEAKAKKAAEDKAREERGKTSGRDQETMEQELSLTFVRLEQTQAKEQYDLAAEKYAASGSSKDKKTLDEAKLRYNQASAALRSAGVEVNPATGEQGKTPVKYTDRPSNPVGRGFDPYTNTGSTGADTPTERAKSTATGLAPNVVINPLDNNRWNNAFDFIPGSEFDYYWKQDTTMSVPISFFANSVGAVYQKTGGAPETQNEAVDRILNEYANAGKMNELRDLFVSSGIAGTPSDQFLMAQANKTQNSQYGKDPNTRQLLVRAIQFGTYFNITAVTAGLKPVSFADFLKSYKGELNKSFDSTGGNGLPKRTVQINKQVFTPEELELNIDAFFQEYTGQGASKEDVDFLVKRFNKQSTQKTVNVRSGETVTSTTTGGLSQAEQQTMMRDMALSDPAAESYNKATTYLDYFRESLASPIELG
jgi:hypothetical protein